MWFVASLLQELGEQLRMYLGHCSQFWDVMCMLFLVMTPEASGAPDSGVVIPFCLMNVGSSRAFLLVAACLRMWLFKWGEKFFH